MIGVMIIPTGIEAKIGGHAGDANPVARVLASVCDKLIVHPNVVNAADFNGITENMLYVEGSMLDRFLDNQFDLKEVMSNKTIVFINEVNDHTVNCINTAKYVLGANVEFSVFPEPLKMEGYVEGGMAKGRVENLEACAAHIAAASQKYDTIALHTPVHVEHDVVKEYVRNGGPNPWGKVEAMVSGAISLRINKPVAHAPIEMNEGDFGGVGFPRLAAEYVSVSHLFSVLQGLHKAPRSTVSPGINVSDIDVLISPMCYGKPHELCQMHDIPIIYVRDNTTNGDQPDNNYDKSYFVENYLEAAGLISAIKSGVSYKYVISN